MRNLNIILMCVYCQSNDAHNKHMHTFVLMQETVTVTIDFISIGQFELIDVLNV